MTDVLGIFNYWIYVVLMMIGLYGVIAKPNLIKQAIALGLFQTGIFLYYISMAVIDGGTAPIWTTIEDGAQKFQGPYDNPLPHVLILTAIVVSVSVLAVALALIINTASAHSLIASPNKGGEADAGAPACGADMPGGCGACPAFAA